MVKVEVNVVLLPEPVFIGFGMLVFHVAHIDIHKGGTGKEMIGFCRDNGDPFVRKFADVSGRSYAGNTISNYYNVFHFDELVGSSVELKVRNITTMGNFMETKFFFETTVSSSQMPST